MGRKAQVTLFLIAAISLILVLGITIFVISSNSGEGKRIAEKNNDLSLSYKSSLQLLVESCLKQKMIEAERLGLDKSAIKEQEQLIDEGLKDCVDLSSYAKQGFKVNSGQVRTELSIGENAIQGNVYYPITMENGDISVKVESYTQQIKRSMRIPVIKGKMTHAVTDDGRLEIIIPEETKILKDKKNRNEATGGIVDEGATVLVEIKLIDKRSKNRQNDVVLGNLIYEGGPEDVTFDPGIELSMKYDPSELPSGIDESELAIAYYDDVKQRWVAKLDSQVDLEKKTITSTIYHFTEIGLVSSSADDIYFDFYGKEITRLNLFGQRNIKETARNMVTSNSIDHAPGVLVDRNSFPNKVYVFDSGNNRILGFNGIGYCSKPGEVTIPPIRDRPCTTDSDCNGDICYIDGRKPADMVFGQADFEGSACNRDNNVGIYGKAKSNTLCLIGYPAVTNIAEYWMRANFDVDKEGNLYIPDVWNNRVLKFNQPFSEYTSGGKGDNVADFVWGQDNFYSNLPNKQPWDKISKPTKGSLWISSGPPDHVSSRGVSVDNEGNVWVADTFNNRVLRFQKDSNEANLVIGQTDFESSGCPHSGEKPYKELLDKLCSPTIARLNPENGKLYVLDEWPAPFLARILVFEPDPSKGFYSGMKASKIIIPKQDNPGYNKPFINSKSEKYVFRATGFVFNPFKEGEYSKGVIWINEGIRITLIDEEGNIMGVVGVPDKYHIIGRDLYPSNCGPEFSNGFFNVWNPGGQIGFDSENNIYISDEFFKRISRFSMPYKPYIKNDWTCLPEANGGLFPFKTTNTVSPDRFDSGVGIAIFKNQLIINDWGLKIWNDFLEKKFDSKPDITVSFGGGIWGRPLMSNAIDDSDRLWLLNEWGKLRVYQLPLTSKDDKPMADGLKLFWKDDSKEINYGGGYSKGVNVAFDNMNKAIYVADVSSNRIFRIKNYDSFNDKLYVDMVIGQPDKETEKCNHDQTMPWRAEGNPKEDGLCSPLQIKFDKKGNLFVVENDYECHGNVRITIFSSEDLKKADTMFPNIKATKAIIGGLTKQGPCSAKDMPGSPVNIAFNSKNELVVGNDGYYGGESKDRSKRQLWLYKNPLTKDTPDANIDLPIGAAGELTFDEEDNLIIQDHTWNKVWIINFDKDPSWLVPIK